MESTLETSQEAVAVLYLEYQRLSAPRLATALHTLNRLYRECWRASTSDRWAGRARRHASGEPDLLIDYVATGSSIKIGFGKPRVVFEGTDVEVVVPKSLVALVFMGSALTWGLNSYDKFLSTIKTRYEITKVQHEVEELSRRMSANDRQQIEMRASHVRISVGPPAFNRASLNGAPVAAPGQARPE